MLQQGQRKEVKMLPIFELLWAFVMTLILIVVDSIKALLPASMLPQKDLQGQTVLVTGAGEIFSVSRRFFGIGPVSVMLVLHFVCTGQKSSNQSILTWNV